MFTDQLSKNQLQFWVSRDLADTGVNYRILCYLQRRLWTAGKIMVVLQKWKTELPNTDCQDSDPITDHSVDMLGDMKLSNDNPSK